MEGAMESDILVSVITVVHNGEATIRDTIESVLGQTYTNLEYIIVDGLSTDKTVQIASSYAAAFKEKGIAFRIVSEKDEGIYDAMNKGISLATGAIVGLINSDDWYESDAAETVVSCYKNTGFDMMYGDLRIILLDGKSFIKKGSIKKCISSRHWNHPTTFITAETYKNFKYDTASGCADFDLIIRVRLSGAKVVVANKVLANFRMGGVSNSGGLKERMHRIKGRYKMYRKNNLSRFYIFDIVSIEIAKMILTPHLPAERKRKVNIVGNGGGVDNI